MASSLRSIPNSYLIFDFSETNGIIGGLGQCNVDFWYSDAFERMTLHFVELLKAEIKAPKK